MADQTSILKINKPGQQGQQYGPVAAAFDQFDQALAGRLNLAALAAGNHTLTDAQFRYAVLAIPALAAARVLTVPARSKVWLLDNSAGGYGVTVKCAGQPGTEVPAGACVFLMCNGVDVVPARALLAPLPAIADAVDEADAVTKLNTFFANAREAGWMES